MNFINMARNKLILFDIDHTLFDTEKFKASKLTDYSLYDEVLEILEKLSKIAELGIFSKGDFEFQKAKLKNTKIEDFFKGKNVHIFQDKILNIKALNQYKNYKIFFVDDRLEVLRDVKKFLPSIIVIWIKRGPHAERLKKIEGFNPDKTIANLSQIVSDTCF